MICRWQKLTSDKTPRSPKRGLCATIKFVLAGQEKNSTEAERKQDGKKERKISGGLLILNSFQLKLIWEKGMEMMQIPRRRELAIRRPRGRAESFEIGHMAEKMNLFLGKCRRIRFSYMGAQLPTPLP